MPCCCDLGDSLSLLSLLFFQPLCKLSLTFFAFIVIQDVVPDAPGYLLNGILWNVRIVYAFWVSPFFLFTFVFC